MHLPALRALPGAAVEAVCDTNPVRLEAFALRYRIPRRSADLESFLAENAGRLDVVLLATPGFTHHDLATQVIEAGFHVFVEKPLASTTSECLDLNRRAARCGVKVCVGQTWRFRDPVLRAIQARDQGLIGAIYQVNVTHHGGSLFHVSEPEWSWREKEHKILIYDHAIHLLDLQVFFAGPVRRVIGLQTTDDATLGCTTRVHALVEHASGAVGLVDVQMFASSNFTKLDLFGTANDVEVKFFPHGFRLNSGRVNPLDELHAEFKRVRDFIAPALWGRIRGNAVPRRAVPHHRILQAFIHDLEDPAAPPPVGIDDVLPTMEFLEELTEHVYA